MDMRFPIIPILGILAISISAIGIIWGVIYIIKKHRQAKISPDKSAKKWYAIIILSVVIMLLSWVFNIGWFRLILTWVPLPLIHTIIFLVINFKSAARASSSSILKKYIPLSCTSYVLSYLLFPDGGDIGGMYLFFSLIRNNIVASIAMFLAFIIFSVNIAILILEGNELKKYKTQL